MLESFKRISDCQVVIEAVTANEYGSGILVGTPTHKMGKDDIEILL